MRNRDRVTVGSGSSIGADAEVAGPAEAILGIASGHLDLADAVAHRLVECTGDADAARSVFRRAPTAAARAAAAGCPSGSP